ncbi:MAG: META domain-containing protein [Chloroflexota bacterium]
MRKLLLILGLVMALALAACSEEPTPTPEPTPEPAATEVPAEPTEAPAEQPTEEPAAEPAMAVDEQLTAGTWYWKEYVDFGEVNSFIVPNPELYTITFSDDGTAAIQADCNNILAEVTTDGSSSLTLSLGPTTMVFCGEESLDVQYTEQLANVATYVIEDGTLYLNLQADAGNMVFGPDQAPLEGAAAGSEAGLALLDVQWNWEMFQDTADINSFDVPDPSDYRIQFLADGTAQIEADCNMVQATYTTDGSSSLTITMGPSTMAFCGEESLDNIYLSRLSEVVSYVVEDGVLYLNLINDAGNMVFGRGPLTISPNQISLDTQGLPYSWQAVVVPETPYDESMPPGPMGLPEHIQILFGASSPEERDPSSPVMYLIPVDAYRDMWDEAGNEYVSNTIDAIQQIAFTMTRPEGLGLPVLPTEEVAGANDIAVQFGRAVPAGEVNETSATQTGYRFVGRWAQDPNPVTNQNLNYVYQGFTNDGYYLVSFWYPVTSSELPDQPTDEAMAEMSSDMNAYLAAEAERLDAFATGDWDPDLAALDALVASLEIETMPAAGLVGQTWLWEEGPIQPGSSEIVAIENPTLYQVTYNADGTVNVSADCNLASYAYEINQTGMAGGMLAQPGPVTLAECGPESFSNAFISSIEAAQNYRVLAGGDQMELALPAAGGELLMVNLASYESRVQPPEPEAGEPTATVTAAVGANVRSGPGSIYPILGVAPLGSSGVVVGVSEDGAWYAVHIPGAPNDQGWVSATVVEVENVENVPVIGAPPPPAQPTATPAPTATVPPSTGLDFTASRTTINAGESATLSWDVQGVTAVYMYPVGANYLNYPTTGQASEDVFPGITTTYVLLAFNPDGSTTSESIEITVVNGLTANRWVLQSYSSPQTGYRTPIPGTQITARFEPNGDLSGNGGCNTYSGGFTAFDRVLRVSNLAQTGALCGDPQGADQQEATYISLLQQAARFQVTAGQLSVFDSAGNRILTYIVG